MRETTEQFFECRPQIVRHLARKVKDAGAREDLLQEVFIKFAAGLGTMRHRDNLCGYLYRITDTTVADYYRKESRYILPGDCALFERAVPHPAADEPYRVAGKYLRAVIEGLSPKYREALTLVDLEGKPQKELARALGVSYSGMKSRVQRAREMVKRAILDCCDYEFDRYGNVVGCCNAKWP